MGLRAAHPASVAASKDPPGHPKNHSRSGGYGDGRERGLIRIHVESDGAPKSASAVTPVSPKRREQVRSGLTEGDASLSATGRRLIAVYRDPVVPVQIACGVQWVNPRHRPLCAEARRPRARLCDILPAPHRHNYWLPHTGTVRSHLKTEERQLRGRRLGDGDRDRHSTEDYELPHGSHPSTPERWRWFLIPCD
jgi:hypothetical protein